MFLCHGLVRAEGCVFDFGRLSYGVRSPLVLFCSQDTFWRLLGSSHLQVGSSSLVVDQVQSVRMKLLYSMSFVVRDCLICLSLGHDSGGGFHCENLQIC